MNFQFMNDKVFDKAVEGFFDKKKADASAIEKPLVDCLKSRKNADDCYKKGLLGKAYQNNTKAENLIKQIMKMLNSAEYDNDQIGKIAKSSGAENLPISRANQAIYNSAMLKMIKKASKNTEYRDSTKNQYLLMRRLALLLIDIRLDNLEIKFALDSIAEKHMPTKAEWRQHLDQMWNMYEPYILSGGYKFYTVE